MSEDPYNDPLIKARDRGIETIAVQLNTARLLAQTKPPQLSPGALAETIDHIERALVLLDGIHAGHLPEQTRESQQSMREHLAAAHALAEEHLDAKGAEGKARLGIQRALSAFGGGESAT